MAGLYGPCMAGRRAFTLAWGQPRKGRVSPPSSKVPDSERVFRFPIPGRYGPMEDVPYALDQEVLRALGHERPT